MDNDKKFIYEVAFSADYFTAYLSIDVLDEEYTLLRSDVDKILQEKNVIFGIDNDMIEIAIQNQKNINKLVIAKGIESIDGVNSVVEYKFDTADKAKPKELSDGKVDFKNIDFVKTANKGEVLAIKTPATCGIDGKTVTGKVVPSKQGKDTPLRPGKNVEVSEDGLTLIATETGTIKFEGDKVQIVKLLEINGDVGLKTGNIVFTGKVIISGNVTTGFRVVAEDDIEIFGIVESAEIYSKGNIKIHRGVQGNDNAILSAQGNIEANFLNNLKVYSKGNIKADSIMHCTVQCDGELTLEGKKGHLVGGEANIRKDLRAKVIGSEIGSTTTIWLGTDSKSLENYQKKLEEIKEIKENLKKVDQAIYLINKQLGNNPENQELKGLLEKTSATKRDINNNLRIASEELQVLGDILDSLKDSKIVVDHIFPGVKVKIGNVYYNLKHEFTNVMLIKEGADIKVISL
jgi:uncharacterized protein (DUF342 family)